ncbi:MAG: hypothetical protein H6673_11325 [Anaerolineales bacterium]|nr:hypothetical protein [Anaerolineales bacterium]
MESWPWWLIMVIQILTAYATGRETGTLNVPEPHPVEGCFVHVKVYEYKVLADMGDGVFENDMEVQMVVALGNGVEGAERVYPSKGYRNLERGDSVRFDDFMLTVQAADELQLYVLAVDIDERFRINGINIGPTALLLGNAARANLGIVGDFIDSTLEATINGFNDTFTSEDIVAEDTFSFYATDNWGAGQRYVQRTTDGGLELTYSVALSGCQRDQ